MDELKNALAWFKAAPSKFANDLNGMGEWILGVLEGDFNDDPTTAQVVTGTVISMIPLVDQICDVRDVVANCRKINQDSSNKWHWVALGLTLIGLFPTLGSLAKGCFKILFAYGRKGIFGASKAALDSNLWQATSPMLEQGIRKLNEWMGDSKVRKAMSALKWDNPYQKLSALATELAGKINVSALTQAMDSVIGVLKGLVSKVKSWGSASMGKRADALLQLVQGVRNKADSALGDAVAPLQSWMNRLAQRLDVEHRVSYKASTNALNPHNFVRPSLADEVAAFEKKKPAWVDKTGKMVHAQNKKAPSKVGWPDISNEAVRPLDSAHKTFKNGGIKPVTYPPGTVLYRVLDPKSNDNSICWMTKAEFDKLKSKDDWRRRFAVWANWNANGEFVTYTVPPGKGLNAWEGVTASQQIDKTSYVLEGGAVQIVLDPKDLNPASLGKREFTGWSYDDLNNKVDLVGVPILKTNWFDPSKK